MKISIENIVQAVKRLFSRFPYSTVLIIIEFLLLSYHVETESIVQDQQRFMIMVAIEMGIFALVMLTIAIQLFSERFNASLRNKILMMAGATLFVAAATYLLNYRDIQSIETLRGAFTGQTYRMFILMFLSGLSLFILPFLKDKGNNAWWNFAITFIARGSISALYSGVLFVGLALAMFALDTFWSISLFDMQYAIAFFLCAVVVAPLHLLNGLYIFDEENGLIELPKYLSIFVKYVLTPLIVIYTVILYPYIFSFPFRDEWPANESSIIILVLLALGYAGVALFYGLNEKSRDWNFARLYTRIFAAVSLPTLVFWVYSLYLRIDAYGVTVNRFVLMAIILWFIGVGGYYLVSKTTNIKYVLTSFFVLLIVLFYIPFTAFFWSERSQINRLVEMAKNEEIYKNGEIEVGDTPKHDSSNQNMKEIAVYVNKYHTMNKLETYLSDEIRDKINIDKNGYSSSYVYAYDETGEVFFKNVPGSTVTGEYFDISLTDMYMKVPAGYDNVKFVNFNEYATERDNQRLVKVDNYTFDIYMDLGNKDVYLSGEVDTPVKVFDAPYHETVNSAYSTSNPELMTFSDGDAILILTTFGGRREGNVVTQVNFATGYLFTK